MQTKDPEELNRTKDLLAKILKIMPESWRQDLDAKVGCASVSTSSPTIKMIGREFTSLLQGKDHRFEVNSEKVEMGLHAVPVSKQARFEGRKSRGANLSAFFERNFIIGFSTAKNEAIEIKIEKHNTRQAENDTMFAGIHA